MDNKICKRCSTEKPISEYYSGDSSCKDCRKLAIRKYRYENIEKIRAYDIKRGQLSHRKEMCVINTRKRRKDPDGYMAAHNSVYRALKKGFIEKMPCCMCGSTEKIHAHHDDYEKPLDVMWLCVIHHKSRHAFLEFINEDTF